MRTSEGAVGTGDLRGTVIADGRYELADRVGAGASGVVYRATQVAVARTVAIKLLHENLHLVGQHKRFVREAETIARLRHPNCIVLHDFGFSDELETYYMVMEFVDGESLYSRMRGVPLGVPLVMSIGLGIAEALAHAHAMGVLHRDLKPSNVMLDRRMRPTVLDFGLAGLIGSIKAPGAPQQKALDPRITLPGQIFGTPFYMAPEQSRGEADLTGVDVYSLGVMLFEMFEGRLPYESKNLIAAMRQHADKPIPKITNSRVPANVASIVRRMLAKEAEDRPNASEVAAVLRAHAPDDTTGESTGVVGAELNGRFVVETIVRQTRMGLLCSGRRLSDGACVDIEIFSATRQDETARAHMLTRSRELAALQHPNILSFLEIALDPKLDRAYAASLASPGTDLESLLHFGRPTTALAVEIVVQLSAGLEYLHNNDSLHAALEPCNIFLSVERGELFVRAARGGLAQRAVSSGTRGGTFPKLSSTISAAPYAAPEMFVSGKRRRPQSDIYSLGCVLFHMLSGRPPYEADNPVELALEHAQAKVPPLPHSVPQPLRKYVREMLHKRSSGRPPTANAVAQRLREIAEELELGPPELPTFQTGDLVMDWGLHSDGPGTLALSEVSELRDSFEGEESLGRSEPDEEIRSEGTDVETMDPVPLPATPSSAPVRPSQWPFLGAVAAGVGGVVLALTLLFGGLDPVSDVLPPSELPARTPVRAQEVARQPAVIDLGSAPLAEAVVDRDVSVPDTAVDVSAPQPEPLLRSRPPRERIGAPNKPAPDPGENVKTVKFSL